jgi:hypothetical protein
MKIQQQIILYIVIFPMRIAILIHIGVSWCIMVYRKPRDRIASPSDFAARRFPSLQE